MVLTRIRIIRCIGAVSAMIILRRLCRGLKKARLSRCLLVIVRIKGIGSYGVPNWSSTGTTYETGGTSWVASGSDGNRVLVTADGGAPGAIGIRQAGGTNYPDIWADLSTATAATINQIRQSFQIQRLLERDARGGTRYTEIIQAHFGVTSPDARLQRPEYLGGSSVPLNVNPIAQTSAVPSQPTPQGNLAAMGTYHVRTGFTKSFTEHGYYWLYFGPCGFELSAGP